MVRALGVKSREIWQLITGLLSAELASSMMTEHTHVSSAAVKALYFVVATVQTVQEQSYIKFVWTATIRVRKLRMRLFCVCYDTCACV